jgi:WD40 repeat protein
LASGTAEGEVLIYDIASKAELKALRGHTAAVSHCFWWANGQIMTTASYDGTIRVWSVPKGHAVAMFAADAPFTACASTAKGHLLVAGNYNGDRFLLRPEQAENGE